MTEKPHEVYEQIVDVASQFLPDTWSDERAEALASNVMVVVAPIVAERDRLAAENERLKTAPAPKEGT